jgi:hypothetical protein
MPRGAASSNLRAASRAVGAMPRHALLAGSIHFAILTERAGLKRSIANL